VWDVAGGAVGCGGMEAGDAAAVGGFADIYMEIAGAVCFRKTMFFKYITELFVRPQGDAMIAAAVAVFAYTYMEIAGRES
jgi:hypothetical protein